MGLANQGQERYRTVADTLGVPEKLPAVTAAGYLADLRTHLNGLEKELEQLYQKILPVLRPQPPATAEQEPGLVEAPCSLLVEEVRSLGRAVMSLRRRVCEVTERVEV